jgi:hypothetical protein
MPVEELAYSLYLFNQQLRQNILQFVMHAKKKSWDGQAGTASIESAPSEYSEPVDDDTRGLGGEPCRHHPPHVGSTVAASRHRHGLHVRCGRPVPSQPEPGNDEWRHRLT